MLENITINKKFALALLLLIISIGFVVFAVNSNMQKEIKVADNANASAIDNTKTETVAVQDIYIKALDTGVYDNREITVKKGIPVRLHFTADTGAGCGKYLAIDDFEVKLISKNGEEAIAEFTPQEAGTYYYHCGMWMFKGKLVVE